MWATPMAHGGGMNADCSKTYGNLGAVLAQMHRPLRSALMHGYDQAHARAELAAVFMAGACDVQLCVDSDIGFDAQWYLAHVLPLASRGCDIVLAPYQARTQAGWALDIGATPDAPRRIDRSLGEPLIDVLGGGMGAVQITRRAYETMALAHPELAYESVQNGSSFDLFSCAIHPLGDPPIRRRRGEDYSFFGRARAVGLTVWCHAGWQVTHAGITANLLAEISAAQENEKSPAPSGQGAGPSSDYSPTESTALR